MKITSIIKILLFSLLLTAASSCNPADTPETEIVNGDVKFALSVDNLSLNNADIRVRHDGANAVKWVYVKTTDLESDADELVYDVVSKELDFAQTIVVMSGNNKSLRLSGLLPKTDYRFIVKAIDDAGNLYGKAYTMLFRTQRDLNVFEENSNWDLKYEGRKEDYSPGTTELVEYDTFVCTSGDEEPYIFAFVKEADYKALEKHPDHKVKLRTFFEQYISSLGVTSWSEAVEKGNSICKEERLRHGDWLLFMVGVDENGELNGLYKQVECLIPEEEPTEDFKKWLGTWEVVGYDEGVPYKFNLTFLSSEANMWYYTIGWEPNNVYGIDPAILPVEVFYDKVTGKAYLVSQYVNSAYDAAGAVMDFYFYGTFAYAGANTFLDAENNKLAVLEMTNDSCTEAKATGLEFTIAQAGAQLTFQYSKVIYYMRTLGQGTAISMGHPSFPFTMTKLAE